VDEEFCPAPRCGDPVLFRLSWRRAIGYKTGMHNLGRRCFLKTLAVGVGASPLLPAYAASPWRFFTADEAALVDALCEQIVPGDDDPGAHDTRVARFIDWQLVGPYRMHQETYRNGLIGVEETSREMFSQNFLELSWDQQTEIMRTLESGKAPGAAWSQQSSRAFFNLVRDHSLQGFYGSPRHGGNRNYASYKMLGLDYPQIIGQNRYRS
jgi:gluconate 2-dehydrogenase gamma chain